MKRDWRLFTGLVALILATGMPLLALSIPFLHLPAGWSAALATVLVVGGPDVLTVLAVVLLGKETLAYWTYRIKRLLPGRIAGQAGLEAPVLHRLDYLGR